MSGKTSLRKTWEVLFPYLLYYLAYNAAYLILIFTYQAAVKGIGGAYGKFMTAHAATVTGVIGGLCMLAGILPLMPMLKEELRGRGETLCFVPQKAEGVPGATAETSRKAEKRRGKADAAKGLTITVNNVGVWKASAEDAEIMTVTGRRKQCVKGSIFTLTVVLAVSVSLGLNVLFTMTGFADGSLTYREVADRQYGVAFAVGLVLYGLVSPFAEEVVFRGVIYNRLRRFYNPAIGIGVSGLFFGAFHGNLVQGVYGACLGMLIAYLYERSGKFGVPILFHAVANLAVYTTARLESVQELLFTPAGCAVLLTISAGCVWAERRLGKAGCAARG